MRPKSFTIVCLDCGQRSEVLLPAAHTPQTGTLTPGKSIPEQCPQCGSQWRDAQYDYGRLAQELPGLLAARPFGLWRYRELLPVFNYLPAYSLGEGGTPLLHATNLGMLLGLPHLYIKDERHGPTHSFKDRQASVGVAVLKEAGVSEAVIASTGNVAIAYSAYAARAGIKLWAFLTSLVPAEKMREVALYGTQVVKVTGTYDQAKQVAAQFAQQRGLYFERGPRTIASVEGMKTIAYEIAEQLTWELGRPEGSKTPASLHAPGPGTSAPLWRAPDWYFQSISGGLGPLGVLKGFNELKSMGLTGRVPAVAGIQVDGCAPMVHAWKNDAETAEPVFAPHTQIATLATGDPGRNYTLLRKRILAASGGAFESVSDDEAFRAMHLLAKMEGLSMEPAAAVAFAGLIRLARRGVVKPSDVVVINCTGHTMPVETIILGENWARSVSIPGEEETGRDHARAEEGLLAALNQVTADRFPRVAIVDDTPDARRLIWRILQSQGNYQLFEAADGREAILLAQKELPDVIILDLMMPEVDGFAVLDALKANARTAHIPVIVVTAKELTQAEKSRLRGQIHSLMQKGDFLAEDLAEEVRLLLE